jgi:hypothetical protein
VPTALAAALVASLLGGRAQPERQAIRAAIRRKSQLLLFALLVAGCAHFQMTLVPLDGSETNDLSRVSLIMEDEGFPLLLRGLDGVPLKSMRVPSAFGKYAYVVSPGRHVLWVKGAPYPHPLLPQRIRCYVLDVELAQGARYLLKEEVTAKKALLLVGATGKVESTGELVDEPLVFVRDCKWE